GRGARPGGQAGAPPAADGLGGSIEATPAGGRAPASGRRLERLRLQGGSLQAMLEQPAMTLDGGRIELGANIELPADAAQAVEAGAGGLGVFRTQVFYLNRPHQPRGEGQVPAHPGAAAATAGGAGVFRPPDPGGAQ